MKSKAVEVGIAYIGGVFTYLVGGIDELMKFLLIMITVDVITGIMKAIYSKEKIDPNKMYIGGFKKVAILLVIAVSVRIDITFNDMLPIREMVIMYYIVMEFTSFVQNISTFVDLPDEFVKYFKEESGE